MSVVSLRTQILEDYLMCPICCNNFIRPKALPCIHSFCESCLRDYVVSRGYESVGGTFPCPVCRMECTMPLQGIGGFPNNHVMSSLSDTLAKSNSSRPVPKPRRSLGQSAENQLQASVSASSSSGMHLPQHNPSLEGTDVDTPYSYHGMHQPAVPVTELGPGGFEVIGSISGGHGTSIDNSPPPPYSSVADAKICSNDSDPAWIVVPKQNPSDTVGQCNFRNSKPTINYSPMFPPSIDQMHRPNMGCDLQNLPSLNTVDPNTKNSAQVSDNRVLYPSVPPTSLENTACSENLMLRFGKQGSTARDFIKPVGLAINKDGHYIISDNGGEQNRIMIFNSGGEITTAFKCGAKVKDVAVTQCNEIIASIDKHSNAVRLFTMEGQLKGEFGKFFTFEKPGGIAELKNKGIVLTGIEGNCIYTLSPQMKFSTKFGRKGNGDGYFLHPGFLAVDSKNQIIVTDKENNCVQVFNHQGKFKHRFGSSGKTAGRLHEPLGVCVDSLNNIIIADSGNFRVEVFASSGRWLSSIVKDTQQLGENVKPVNVAVTPTGTVAVLLRGPYFAEVRIYVSRHQQVFQEGPVSTAGKMPSAWYN